VEVLEGKRGPAREIVLLNAAAAIAAGEKADSLRYAIPIAAESLDSGAALDKLRRLQAMGR